MDFIKNLETILICDIGASACDPTSHIENLLNKSSINSVLFIGLAPISQIVIGFKFFTKFII